jgi:hypothetical protein
MFKLTAEEAASLRFQNGISNGRGGRRYLPYAFTREGVAMLSSVLRSNSACQMNIFIMRAFVRFTEILPEYKTLVKKVDELEKKSMIHDDNLRALFQTLRSLILDLTKANKLPPDQRIPRGRE